MWNVIPCSITLMALTVGIAAPAFAASDGRGAEIYAEKCQSCHGVAGAGTAEVPQPLFGDRPTVDLADVIARTMPDGSPEDCVGEEARHVAEFMQATFYSPEAQARLNPPRIELSRLTVQS